MGWLARNVPKTLMVLEAAATKDTGVLERSAYKSLKSLSEIKEEMNLTGKQKTVLRTLVEKYVKSLEETIIPEYQRRNLLDYLEDAQSKLELLKGLKRKLV